MTIETVLPGERLDVLERVVVSPATGRFTALPPQTVTAEGEIVRRGQLVGVIDGPGGAVSIESPFTGFLMGVLAVSGERIREGEPVAWLRTTEVDCA
jgi:biotin carboxyl carrier protein